MSRAQPLAAGVFCADKSNLSGVGGDIQVGMLSAGAMSCAALGVQSARRGGVLAGLNAAMVGPELWDFGAST